MVANKNNPNEMLVRTRTLADAEDLADLLERQVEIVQFAGSDYDYRFFVTRSELIELLTTIAEHADYTNFKNHLAAATNRDLRTHNDVYYATLGLSEKRSWAF